LCDLRLPGLVVVTQHVAVLVGAHDLVQLAGADLLAADDERNVHHLVVLPLQFRLEQGPLHRPRSIGNGGFVVGFG
jgi:hypothetical protein